MKTKYIIVTGGAGFIGSHVVELLNKLGAEKIIIVDHLDSEIKEENLLCLKFTHFEDKTKFRKLLESHLAPDAEIIFHLGACTSTLETDEKYIMDNNFNYTVELCRWALIRNIRFIYASSAAVYGDGSLGFNDDHKLTFNLKPLNLYALSKWKFDVWVIKNDIINRCAGIRFFNVYGPREQHKNEMRSVVCKAYEQIVSCGKLKLFKSYNPEYKDGEQKRDFVYVKDAARFTVFFMEHPELNGIYNCGTGIARTWIDLAKAVFNVLGISTNIEFIDMPENLKHAYQYYTCACMEKAEKAGITIKFTSLEEGVKEYVNYLKQFYKKTYEKTFH